MAGADHFLAELGLHFGLDGDDRIGRADVLPELCVPGTQRTRIAVLATYADLLAGHPPLIDLASTAQLEVRLLGDPPADGFTVVSRTVKAGRTLLVGETTFTAVGAATPFAHSLATFMVVPGRLPHRGEAIWGRGGRPGRELVGRVGVVKVAPGDLELHRRPDLTNGPDGTFQGGISALLGEVAATSWLDGQPGAGGPWVVEQLDVRYLRGIRTGPARTVVHAVGPVTPARATLVVQVLDGPGGPLASYVVATARRLSPG